MLWYTKARRAQNDQDYETWIEGGVMPTMNAFDNGDVRTTIIVFHPHYHDGARVQGDTMNTLTSRMGTGGNNVSMVATIPIQDGRDINKNQKGLGIGKTEDPMYTLDSVSEHGVITIFSHTQGLDAQPSDDVSPTLRAAGAGMAAQTGSTVRRLTPVECERLQGFPDDWTAGQSDSSRYKQMGNAVAVPVVEWVIGNICDIV
jgi:site-specific DNA-cytosine methylase